MNKAVGAKIRYDKSVEMIKNYWWQFGLMGIGLVLVIVGIVAAQRATKGEPLVILESSPSPAAIGMQVVDVEGAVEKPGVYRLPGGSRVGEAIIMAGGLSVKADRGYVARFINQAEAVRDGMKLYIPEEGEQPELSSNNQLSVISGGGLISINTASEAELDSLWGVGAARAKTIIENRPYTSLTELVTKAKLTQDVIDKNQGKIGL